MPEVDGKHFTYDPAGIKQAQAYAEKTGKPIGGRQRYMAGGIVESPASSGSVSKGQGKVSRVKKTRIV